VRLAASILALAVTAPAFAEWTVGAFAGGCRTGNTSLTLVQPAADTSVTFVPVRYRSASFEMPIYYGYRVGAFLAPRWLGVEGELIHMKVIADTARASRAQGTVGGQAVAGPRAIDSVLDRFSITHGVNLLLANVVVRRAGTAASPSRAPRWMLVGRIGAGASIPHPESTSGGLSLERYEWGAFSMQGAAAAEVRITGPLYVSGEYKLTRTVQDVTIAGGSARTPLVTHHLVAGLTLHLGFPD
jgi:hypothetical protein